MDKYACNLELPSRGPSRPPASVALSFSSPSFLASAPSCCFFLACCRPSTANRRLRTHLRSLTSSTLAPKIASAGVHSRVPIRYHGSTTIYFVPPARLGRRCNPSTALSLSCSALLCCLLPCPAQLSFSQSSSHQQTSPDQPQQCPTTRSNRTVPKPGLPSLPSSRPPMPPQVTTVLLPPALPRDPRRPLRPLSRPRRVPRTKPTLAP